MVIITAISLLRNKWCRILMFYFHFCSPPSILSTHYVLKITEEGVLKWHNSVLLLPLIWSVFYLESERNHTKVNCSISIFILSLNIVHFFFSFMSMLVLFPPHFYLSQHWQKKCGNPALFSLFSGCLQLRPLSLFVLPVSVAYSYRHVPENCHNTDSRKHVSEWLTFF